MRFDNNLEFARYPKISWSNKITMHKNHFTSRLYRIYTIVDAVCMCGSVLYANYYFIVTFIVENELRVSSVKVRNKSNQILVVEWKFKKEKTLGVKIYISTIFAVHSVIEVFH